MEVLPRSMICGRLREENRDPSNIQVTVSQSGEAEELCLQDVNGVFLRIPTRASPTPSSEYLLNHVMTLFCRKLMAFLRKRTIWSMFLV